MAAGLTKASIVQAAFDLLDEAGMDGLTVRTLAARLGVKAPALYWHVPGKQALLDEMATQVWRRVGDAMDAVADDLPWRDLMATYAATMRRELLAHRDGAKAFSGTTLTDPDVVRRQEVTFARLVRQGFTLQNAARGLLLLHYFTIGACVEEQATAEAIDSGDDRYQPGRRAEILGPDAPLAAEAGEVIFGDPETRFAELTSLLLETIARLRPLRPRQPRRHRCSRCARKLLQDEDGPAALLVLSQAHRLYALGRSEGVPGFPELQRLAQFRHVGTGEVAGRSGRPADSGRATTPKLIAWPGTSTSIRPTRNGARSSRSPRSCGRAA